MFHFIVYLILINACSITLGAPTNIDNVISNWLSNLATSCENQFLSTQILNKTQACQVSVPPYHEKQFECLIFYDINKQLCEAVKSSKLELKEDYSAKIQEHQDVSQLCSAAKDWTFSDNGEVYNRLVRAVFHDSIRCSKVCTVDFDDILNVDANYVCKYIKWGNEMLKPHISPESVVVISAPQASAQVSGMVNEDKAVEVVTQNKISDTKTETNSMAAPAKQNDFSDNKVSSDKAVATKTASSDTSDIEITNKVTSVKQTEQIGVSDNVNKVEPQSILLSPNTALSTKEQPKIPISKVEDIKDKTTSEVNKNEVEDKKPPVSESKKDDTINQMEVPKPKEIEDDIDPDDSEDGLLETQGDDDDPSLTDLEPKIEDMDKKPVKSNDMSIYNNDISQKEMYPNTIPDGFSEDDDHFFPFFLTAIIMIILIYVLYHNKSKVSKVFLGLVVEGRQSNRRRNSRGHAYRRLDTLEQAMSANSAAPPSKIIY